MKKEEEEDCAPAKRRAVGRVGNYSAPTLLFDLVWVSRIEYHQGQQLLLQLASEF